MTDLEICKRIAEIEGIHVSNAECGMYDPLTDKTLCFDLMVKYKVSLVNYAYSLYGDRWEAEINYIADVGIMSPYEMCNYIVEDENPQRAVCLTIIEAHKND